MRIQRNPSWGSGASRATLQLRSWHAQRHVCQLRWMRERLWAWHVRLQMPVLRLGALLGVRLSQPAQLHRRGHCCCASCPGEDIDHQ